MLVEFPFSFRTKILKFKLTFSYLYFKFHFLSETN